MPSGTRTEWRRLSLDEPPRMMVGWREPSHRLGALRVRLHQGVFGELRGLCRPAADRLQHDRERPYETFAGLEDGEYFWYPYPGETSLDEDTADLVRLVQSVDALEEITREDLDQLSFSFYSICWPHNSVIGFVSRRNPISTLTLGYRYFQYADTMKAAERPDFALKEGADLVVTSTGVAILSPSAFNVLLGDIGVSFEKVPYDVIAVRRALAHTIKLTAGAGNALLAESLRTQGNAKRLRLLPDRLRAIKLSPGSLRAILAAHGEDPARLLNSDDQFSFDESAVNLFFDTIEWRFFEDELGGERRRADRFSKR